MLNRFPDQPPELAELLRDPLLKRLTATQLARRFEVSERTWRRWATDGAPVSVRLAIWAISLHGLDTLQREAGNTAALYRGLARATQQEVQQLNERLAMLMRVGDFGAANAPSMYGRPRLPLGLLEKLDGRCRPLDGGV